MENKNIGLRYEPKFDPSSLNPLQDNIDAELKKALEADPDYQVLVRKHKIRIYQEQIRKHEELTASFKALVDTLQLKDNT